MQVITIDKLYQLVVTDSVTTLQRFSARTGDFTDVLQVYHAKGGNVLVINKYKFNSYRFKCKNVPVKFKRSDNSYIGLLDGTVNIYRLPNHMQYHSEIMQSSKSMLHMSTAKFLPEDIRDNLAVDYDGILNNMLEFLCKI